MNFKEITSNFFAFFLFSLFLLEINALPTKKKIEYEYKTANCNFTKKDYKRLELDIEDRKELFNNLLSSGMSDESTIEEAKKLMFVSSNGQLLPIIVIKDKTDKFELTSVLFGCDCAQTSSQRCQCRRRRENACDYLGIVKNKKQNYYRVKDQMAQAIRTIRENKEVKKTVERAIANPNSEFSLSKLHPKTETIQSFAHLFSFAVDDFILERAIFSDWKNFERKQKDIRISIPGTMIFFDGSERYDCLYTFCIDKSTKEIYHRKMEWIKDATWEEMAALLKGNFNYSIIKELLSNRLASSEKFTREDFIKEIEIKKEASRTNN